MFTWHSSKLFSHQPSTHFLNTVCKAYCLNGRLYEYWWGPLFLFLSLSFTLPQLSLYLIMFVHISYSSRRPTLLLECFHSDLTPHLCSLHCWHTVLRYFVILSFLTPYVSFDFFLCRSHHPPFPFPFSSFSFLSNSCLMFHSVSPSVVPLDLLFFLFSFSCWDASSSSSSFVASIYFTYM